MNRVAIAFLTKDRTELTRRSIEPLMQPDKFDLHWFDGSVTEEGLSFADKGRFITGFPGLYAQHVGVVGGPDAAVVYAITTLLTYQYDYIGLCENDVLLHPDWFGPTMALFERGKAEGLEVGAVSARCYQDRILIQRDGYAVVHNLGWGTVIFSRRAAELTLQNMRCSWTTDNVLLFSQLANLDTRKWWAFRGAEQWLCADWRNDAMLAAHGLASLALTPSPVEMIGQDPPLAEQGLQLADGKFELLRNDMAFKTYRDNLKAVREGTFKPTFHQIHRDSQGYLYFPHQLGAIGGSWENCGNWKLKWAQGFGPFAWRAGEIHNSEMPPYWLIPVLGPCSVIVSGGDAGGKVHVEDEQSGYEIELELTPESQNGAYQLAVPGSVAYRNVRVTAKTPGVVFYGLRTQIEQPTRPCKFDWNGLPPV